MLLLPGGFHVFEGVPNIASALHVAQILLRHPWFVNGLVDIVSEVDIHVLDEKCCTQSDSCER